VLARGARPAVEAALFSLEGLEVTPPVPGQEPAEVVYRRSAGDEVAGRRGTLVGRAFLSGARLIVETNSRRRADALRGLVERACGELVRFRIREHIDPLSDKAEGLPATIENPIPVEPRPLVLEYKELYYSDWADQPLPALGGLTPRAAARTRSGRDAVAALLERMDRKERQIAPPEHSFDFGKLRLELGIE
jgi:hypothetical protein